MFNKVQLGSYNPVFRSISVNKEEIKRYNPRMQLFIQELVWRHETTHWEQLNCTTAGHLITMANLFRRYTVRNGLLFFKTTDKSFPIAKPFAPYIESILRTNNHPSLSVPAKTFINDITALDCVLKYFNNKYTDEELKQNWPLINQGLFSFYDLYIERMRPLIDEFETSERLVKINQDFWAKQSNYAVYIDVHKDKFPSFEELIECGAQLVEYKYYLFYKSALAAQNISFSFNEGFLINEYVKKVSGIFGRIFHVSEFTEPIYDIISKIIFASLNPPVVPHFKSCWKENISVKDIHPGMRYHRICATLGTIFNRNINTLLQNDLWQTDIYKLIDNPSSAALASEVNSMFSAVRERMVQKTMAAISGAKEKIEFIDSEWQLNTFLTASELRGKHEDYFINSSPYSFNEELFKVTVDVNSVLPCPLIYNNEISKFQVNMGTIKLQSTDLTSGLVEVVNETPKTITALTEFTAYGCIRDGIYNELDNQFLHRPGRFSLEIFDNIDTPRSELHSLIAQYEKSNEIALKDIVIT